MPIHVTSGSPVPCLFLKRKSLVQKQGIFAPPKHGLCMEMSSFLPFALVTVGEKRGGISLLEERNSAKAKGKGKGKRERNCPPNFPWHWSLYSKEMALDRESVCARQ